MFVLNREQREATVLLSIGTFLEYFDLMLYVHMAVLLNELFFPKTDPSTASILTASAFCSTYILRPFGALIFGYLGDNIGRKSTVIITTMLMSISCITMANLPTYSQIGITAAWVITICRMIQGMSSVGEVIGAEIYLTEITEPPIQYPVVTLISVFSSLGAVVALSVAFFVTYLGFNWRIAFWIGAVIAIVGAVARTRLQETAIFTETKKEIKKTFEKDIIIGGEKLGNYSIYKEKVNKMLAVSLFLIDCTWPACFYFVYMYCGNILKNTFDFSAEQVIHQNFIVSIVHFLGFILLAFLSYKIYPLIIIKVRLLIFSAFILICPYLLYNIKTSFDLLLIQSFVVLFASYSQPALSIFLKYFPVFKRFTYAGFAYALARTFMYVSTPFGLVYLTKHFGHWGILGILIPITIAYGLGISYFEKLEIESGNYHNKKR